MKVTDFYQLLSPLGFLVLAVLFLLLARTRPEIRSANWFSGTYALAACGFTISFFRTYFDASVLYAIGISVYMGATVLLSIGLIRYAGNFVPKKLFALAVITGLPTIFFFEVISLDRQAAQISTSLLTGALLLSACFIAWSPKANRIHKIVVALYAGFGLSFLVRVALVIGLGGLTKINASPNLLAILSAEALISNMLALLCAVGMLVAYTIRLVSLIRTEANTDPLTGLLNRRAFHKVFEDMRMRTDKTQENLFIVLADLDKFKSVNDLYGHAAGDQLIKRTGQLMQQACEQNGAIARIGGEEFAVVIIADNLQAAAKLANKMRLSIQNLLLDTHRGPQSFTISMGVAQCIEGEGLQQTQDRADNALYLAKNLGRNRVVTQEHLAIFKLRHQAETSLVDEPSMDEKRQRFIDKLGDGLTMLKNKRHIA